MITFVHRHPKVTALLFSLVISATWLGSIVAGLTSPSPDRPRVLQLPDVVVIGRRADLDAGRNLSGAQTARATDCGTADCQTR